MITLAFLDFTISDCLLLWEGLEMTFLLALSTVLIALPLGVILGIMRNSRIKIISWPATFYIELIRSIPLVLYVVLLFMTLVTFDKESRGVFTLSSFTAAYIAEIVRGGLNSLDKNQLKAAYSLGMNPFQVYFYIAIPQALARMIPALINQFNVVIKDTSIISYGIMELTKAGKVLSERNTIFSLQIIIVIAAVYFILCYGLSVIGYFLEKRFCGKYKRFD